MWEYFFSYFFGTIFTVIVVVVAIIYVILKCIDFEGNPLLGGVTLECHHCHKQTLASHQHCQYCGGELQ